MKRTMLAATVAGLTLAALPAAAQQARVNWQMQSAFAANWIAVGEPAVHLTETLKAMSGGQIALRFVDPGKLVPALQIFDAVAAGTLDSGFAYPGYWAGKMPAADLFATIPFGPDMGEYIAWMYDGGGQKLYEEIYRKRGVHPIPCSINSAETAGWFNKEINSVADLKGLKFRIAGPGAKVMAKLGVNVTLIPPAELFQAMERGVIDGTEFGQPALDRMFGLERLAKFYYFPGWHQPAAFSEFIVNRAKWDALSDADKAMFQAACKSSIILAMTRSLSTQGAAMDHFRGTGKITVKVLPKDVLDALRKATGEVMEEQAEKDAEFKQVWESIKAFRANYRKWSDVALKPLAE